MESNKENAGITGLIDDLLVPKKLDMTMIKDEIWSDLSNIYYKYEGDSQKKAFRKVMQEISSNISIGKWKKVYNKLYPN